jgi:lipopolysaccharide export system permease protein
MLAAVLALLVWLSQSLQFLQYVINKGLAIGAWLKLTVLLLPSFIGVILPVALFFVVLFVYNKLMLDRELVVVQAAGVSRFGIATPALLIAVATLLVGYVLSMVAAPASYRVFRTLQWDFRTTMSQILLREGTFNPLADGLTVYVRDRGPNGELEGVIVHDVRQPQESVTLIAEKGALHDSSDGPRLTLVNGSRQALPKDTGNLSMLYFESYTLNLGDIAADSIDRYADNRERPTGELLAAREDQGIAPRTVARMHAEAHQRLVGPLAAIGYTLVALGFLLSGGFDRRGQAERIIGAVGTIVLLEAAGLGAMNLAARALTFVPLMYAVALLPIVGGLYMIAAPLKGVWPVPRMRSALKT